MKYKIAICKDRHDVHCKNEEWDWPTLVKKLSTTKYDEKYTLEDYLRLSKDDQDNVKDIGGFVGGHLEAGRRKRGQVTCRSLITLDIDDCPETIIDDLEFLNTYKGFAYSTRKHKKSAPRLRLVLPMTREVTEEEYAPIARKIASELPFAMECLDKTTYQANRLMYWPSTCKDSEFYCHEYEGDIIDPDKVLSEYTDWRNAEEWPIAKNEEKVSSRGMKVTSPLKKNGIIGDFCNVFSIYDVIEQFLSDVYTPGSIKDRYTYVNGSTSNGAIVYEDGLFLYSQHSTDPACGQLCNAFDLVRIHKFGHLDEDIDEDTHMRKRPSYKECKKWALEIPEVKKLYDEEMLKGIESASEDFKDLIESEDEEPVSGDTDWKTKLHRVSDSKRLVEDYYNFITILTNDPKLKNKVGINEFTGSIEVIGKLPWIRSDDDMLTWGDNDDSQLFGYINMVYGLKNKGMLSDATEGWIVQNKFNPVKKFIESVKWDGVPRLENYFIDYLGADDNKYVRSVTKKMFVAAVSRIYRPGCKFDYMVTLVGKQGLGKSVACRMLAGPGGKYFSDTTGSSSSLNDKDAYGNLKGKWIIEWGELAALKKAEREQVKLFISKQVDSYRPPFGKRMGDFPRRCIFIGTTNEDSFLNDATGARRFLVIDCHGKSKKNSWDITVEEINQMWAEAKVYFDQGYNIMDTSDIALEAVTQQEAHAEEYPSQGLIESYLDTRVPVEWDQMSIEQRRSYISATEDFRKQIVTEHGDDTKLRDRITSVEIWCECFGKDRSLLLANRASIAEINNCLKKLGWLPAKTKSYFGEYGQQRYYTRPELDVPW